jgi:DNA polymerase III alpha subunit
VPASCLNKKLFSSLAYCGALDVLGERNRLIENFERIIAHCKSHQAVQRHGQIGLFDEMGSDDAPAFVLESAPAATLPDCLRFEKEYLGLYVSRHPLQGLKSYFGKKVLLAEKITKKYLGKTHQFAGLVTNPKKIFTKSGSYMMQFLLEDPSGRIHAVVFPKAFGQFGHLLKEDHIVAVTGRLDLRRDEYNLTVDAVSAMSLESMVAKAKELGLYHPEERVSRQTVAAAAKTEESRVVLGEDGEVPVEHDDIASLLPKHGERTPSIQIEDDTLVIRLPHDVPQVVLGDIKTVLQSSKGVHPVELHLIQDDGLRRIRLPGGVSFEGSVKEQLENLFQTQKIR